MKNLENQIFRFEPFCEVEAKDREYMLEALELERDLLIRYNLMHFTSSAFVVNPNRDKMLCVYHNIYKWNVMRMFYLNIIQVKVVMFVGYHLVRLMEIK